MAFRRSQIIAVAALSAFVLVVALALLPGESRAANGGSGLTIVLWLFLAALLLATLAIVYAIVRGPLGKGTQGELAAAAGQSPFPRGRSYLVLMLSYMAFTIYGCLLPFQFTKLDFGTAWKTFSDAHYWRLDMSDRSDWAANILLYMPLGYLAMAALTVDRRGRLPRLGAVLPVVVCGTGLSAAIEFAQLWIPIRTSSASDIAANSLGTLLGAAVWLVMGQTATDWIRSYTASQRRRTQVDRLLEFYLVGLIIYWLLYSLLLPLYLTISPAELYHKYHPPDGQPSQVFLVPFSDFVAGSGFSLIDIVLGLMTDVAIFVPVGMYLATALTTPERPIRRLLPTVALGVLVATALEMPKFFVASRFSSTHIVSASLGALIGAAIMNRWRGISSAPVVARAIDGEWRRACGYFAAAGAYSLFLVPIFCSQSHWLSDPVELRARFNGFWTTVPFTAFYFSDPFNALNQVLRKTLFYAPLGVLAALGIANLRLSRTNGRLLMLATVLYAAAVSFSIEMLKVMLPPHGPDITVVMFASVAAAAGAAAAQKAIHADDPPPLS